ncbi:hemerythrin domain-containing protein [Niveibacterium umoris]|uniref:Hemerythrin-like domain-containing protein n=1 Tax=Niveibacterium umoris TaxID=1193620 RepID=A0A840BMD8_9RHOO|nr:hemerythrin domain-containing protein [Niveibacterium umoris]MBB4013674.1 hemerythrin-like domain-containing protein [Niveibacterium umoris]
MQTPRHDIYAFIHKGLRAFMAHTLVRVGRLDAHDAAEVAVVSDEVRALLDICTHHLANENRHIHSAMQARQPGACAEVEAEHVAHEHEIAQLRWLLERVPENEQAAQGLYRQLSDFVAHNFEHMGKEEREHNAVLWAHYSDDEIRAIEHAIIANESPEHLQLAIRWMLPHMTPSERAGMLGGMRQTAPAEMFEGVLNLIRPLLGGRDWRKLSLALGI